MEDVTYEFDFDVEVPVKNKRVVAKNEDEAFGLIQAEYEKKGISKERLSEFKWRVVPKKVVGTA